MKRTGVAMVLAAVGLLLALVNLNAGATTVYGWYPVNDEPFILFPYGQIEVTDAAQRAGSLSYGFYHYGTGAADPSSPLIEFQFDGHIMQPRSDVWNDWVWSIDADFLFGDYLRGSVYINDGENSYWMSTPGNGQLWTISGFFSDNPDTGCYFEPCGGATGYWMLEFGPEPVPEPNLFAAFSFLAFGLLGIDAVRRWRRDHRRQRPAHE